MSALTRWVLAHKRTVVLLWLLLAIAGAMAAGPASRALDPEFSVPNREGWETNVAIAQRYGGTGGDSAPLLPVVTLAPGATVDAPAVRADLRRLDARLARALPGARIASFASTGDRAFVSRDRRTTFAMIHPRPDPDATFGENPRAERAARAALAGVTVGGRPVRLTGFDALADESGSGGGGPGVLLEAVLGAAGALVVLGFVFASFLAVVPLVMAVVAILTTFLALLGLTQVTSVSPIVQFLIALIGLGVAIDYALLIVSRWREERAHGRTGDDAVQHAMETAGRAVVFSGVTVAIGLLALIALPLPFLRSMGYGGMLIPLVSTLVAITLLPVVLATVGPRLDWPHRRTDDRASRAWTRWATLVAGRRWVAAVGGLTVAAALAFAATDLQLGSGDADTIARSGDARQGLVALERSGIGEGALLPHEILVARAGDAGRVTAAVRAVPGVHGAVAPDGAAWRRGGSAIVEAVPRPDSGSGAGGRTLDGVRDTAHAAAPGTRVGGQPAANADFVDAVYGSFPLMIALITITTFVLLARAFRSLLLPAKAILLNILSVAAAWGVLVLVWQHGLWLGGHLGHPGDRLDPVVDAAHGVCVPVRPVDGLRGLHPQPDARGVRPDGLDRDRRRPGHRADRAARDERGADPVPLLRVDGLRAGHRREDAGDRARGRDPARRNGHPRADRARGHRAHGPLELVAAALARPRPARRAVAAGGGPSSPGVIAYGVVTRPERTAATTSAGRRDALRERRARRVAVMDLELRDKVAVVTGASKGIGLAVVRQLAEEGALVVAGARSTETLDGLDRVTAYAVDLVDPDGPGRLVAHAIDLHGRVDVLVNNVGGVHPRVDGFLSITDADFEASMQLNFFAALRATRAAVADMLERREGTIVNVASVNAFFEPDGAVVDYGAAKAALLNVAKALSQELAPKGIRINSVSPGPVATDLWLGDDGVAATIGRATGADPDAIRTQVIDQGIPTGRFSTPEEVATLVALLASPRTANVTGSDYVIDGGLIKTM